MGSEGAQVGQFYVEVALCCPSALVVEAEQAHFVHPNGSRFGGGCVVAHTNHHHLYLAQRGATHNANSVFGVILVVLAVYGGVVHPAALAVAQGVAFYLYVCEFCQWDVYHILLRPHNGCSTLAVAVVRAVGGDVERYLVFVVVALVVGTQAHEYRKVVVGELCDINLGRLGVHIQLYALILAYIQVALFVNGTRLLAAQVVHLQREGLLVVLAQLRLAGVYDAAYSGGQHIVHGFSVAVFLYVYGCHCEVARNCWGCVILRCNGLLIGAPVAANELHCGKAQCYGLAERGHIHTQETYGCEVAYVAHGFFIVLHGDAEFVPIDTLGIAVAQLGAYRAFVGYVVAAHLHILGAQRYVVLEEILILVHREVLVGVLNVGCAFGGAAVALATRCGRVALAVIEIFVALHYAFLHSIVVATSEVVVVVACGVGCNAVVHLGTHPAFNGIEIVLVGGVGGFACIV